MHILKYSCVLAAVGFLNVGCQTLDRPDKSHETTVTGVNDVARPVGCMPADRDPAVIWQVTGHPNYVTPGCETNTTAAVVVPVTDDAMAAAAGDEALAPLDDVIVEDEEVAIVPVPGQGGSPCGITVTAISSGAVGDPCMTTEDFVESLNLSSARKDAALAEVNTARTMFGDRAIAH